MNDTVRIQPLPYDLRYSSWSKNRSATKEQQDAMAARDEAQAAIMKRDREELDKR